LICFFSHLCIVFEDAQIHIRPVAVLAEPWMIWVVIGSLALLAYSRLNFPAIYKLMAVSITHYRVVQQEIRDVPPLSRRGLISLIPFALAVWTLFFYLGIKTKNPELDLGFTFFAKLIGVVCAIYVIKVLAIRAVQILTDGDFGLEEYIFNLFLFAEIGALVLFPIVLIASYVPLHGAEWWLWFGVGFWVFTYFWRLFRGVMSAFQHRTPMIYIILYLCALEILPLLVVFRVLDISLH
jgi:hypothetical protein